MLMKFWLAIAGIAAAVAFQAIAEEEPAPDDLLTLSKGAVLVSASHDPTKALALTDGDDRSNWSASTKNTPPPYTFVFELIAPASLTNVGIDGSGPRPGGVMGASARRVSVEGSAESPDEGFIPLASFDAAEDGTTLVPVASSAPVRWLKFSVNSAQDPAASWLYLDEVIAHGTLELPAGEDRFTGIFQSGRADLIELYQNGMTLKGCFVENSGRSAGRLDGAVIDGVAFLNWTTGDNVGGTAVLTRTSSGELAGVRYRHKSRTAWGGPPASDNPSPRCSDDKAGNAISEALEADGEARLYGILFSHDSDVPRSVSLPTLQMLLEALQADTALRVEIEGHTDSDGTDGYNLDLSARRAASVVAWLVDYGIGADRLQSSGKGESEPVASNETADGKALNRRVDVVKL